MKIANKITFSFIFIILLLLAVVLPAVYLISEKNISKLIYAELRAVANSRVKHIETFIKLHDDIAENLASSITLREFFDVGSNDSDYAEKLGRVMIRLQDAITADESIFEIFIVNAKGIIVASTAKEHMGLDRSNDVYFLGAKEKPYIKGPYYSHLAHRPSLDISAPMLDHYTHKFLGVTVIRINTEELDKITTDTVGLGKTGEIILINKYFFMITPSRFLPGLTLKERLDTENARICMSPKDNKRAGDYFVISKDYRGVPVIGTGVYIPGVEWGLIAKIDTKEAFAPLRQVILLMLIIILSVPWFFLILGNLVSHKLTKSIEDLHRGMEIVGGGNLDFKVGTPVKDEVGQLSRGFDRMTERLKYTTVSLDKLNKEISERKIAEEKYGAILRATKEGFWIADTKGNLVEVNDAYCKMIGYSREELSKMKISDIEAAENPKDVALHIQKMVKTGGDHFESRHRRKDGKIIDVDINATHMKQSGQGFFVLFLDDITDRKAKEEVLRESEEKFRAVAEYSHDAILRFDKNSHYLYVNPAVTRETGIDGNKFLGKTTREMGFSEELCKLWQDAITEVFETGDFCRREFRLPVGIWIDGFFIPEKGKDGKVMAVLLTARDITERKRAEEELKAAYDQLKATQAQLVQSAKMASVGLLAGGVAHEINNPLTGVLNNVQLIKMMVEQKKEFSMDEFKELLGLIEESAQRCTKITRSLLSFSRASKGIFQNVILNEMVEKVVVLVEHELRLQNITVNIDFATGLPEVKGDPQLLQQIVFDIIANARWAIEKKSGKDGGTISIKTASLPETNSVFLSISDTGIGIPKENLVRIFEPFFTTKQVGEGTGLGLSIVYSIIREHKGTITVESQEGNGTTFRIVLPIS